MPEPAHAPLDASGKGGFVACNMKAVKKTAKTPGKMSAIEKKLRARYKKHTPEQRAIYGDEPSQGTIIAAEIRAECNHHTREQRQANAARFMSLFYQDRAEAFAARAEKPRHAAPAHSH
jgi:hypothetical protein